MTIKTPVSGSDRLMLVDGEIAEAALRMRWCWDGREMVALKDGQVVRPAVDKGKTFDTLEGAIAWKNAK